jgi:predicted NACHT family NTPase
LNVLLSKWDGQRRIQRGEEVYKGLSLKRKETLLGQLAMYTFERGDYFFKEKVATQQIEQYIRNLPGAKEDPAALEVDSRAVLKSIESRHGLLSERATGIYSFSHLTFQEYFTAKNILDLSNPAAQESALGNLVEHIGEKRWKEVFLLVVEGLDNADYLLRLMKQQIDLIAEDDLKLQQFLEWVEVKSTSVKVEYGQSAIRAFYYTLARARDFGNAHIMELDLIFALDVTFRHSFPSGLQNSNFIDIDLDFNIHLHCSSIDQRPLFIRCIEYNQILITRLTNIEVKSRLQSIYDRVPDHNCYDQFQNWWEQNGKQWLEDLRQIMIKYRNIGHDWQFTDEQKAKLQEYYDANLLLANCLNSECYVSREVREEIEATMLLPVAEIEKWKAENGRN